MADPIKSAFQKVKEDMQNLQTQLNTITRQILELKRTLDTKIQADRQPDTPTDRQTNTHNNQTNPQIQTDNQTVPQEIGGSINRISGISTGNEGVQTDRQTNQQTDRQTTSTDTIPNLQNIQAEKFALSNTDTKTDTQTSVQISPQSENTVGNISKVSQVLSSLDSLKQDLRSQFKRLTPQEMLVFATIYQLTDQNISPDYSLLAIKTNLSESSIRDYVGKLIKKGIPVDKTKENNKRVSLTIPVEFKRMASLQTLYELRNL
jgi:predicted transcriptional regulator